VLECHINRRGNTVMAVHDLNDELGQPPPNKWEDQFPNEVQEAKNIFAKYVQYLMEEERGEEDEHEGKLLSPKKVKMCLELETDDAGYPLLPDAAAVRGTPYASDSRPSSAPATSSLFRNAFGRVTSYATRSRPASPPTCLLLMTR